MHTYLLTIFQVLDWLQNHGEVFLRKNVGIGRNLQKARAYQKSHETFEGVVQVGHLYGYIMVVMELFSRCRRTASKIQVVSCFKLVDRYS